MLLAELKGTDLGTRFRQSHQLILGYSYIQEVTSFLRYSAVALILQVRILYVHSVLEVNP